MADQPSDDVEVDLHSLALCSVRAKDGGPIEITMRNGEVQEFNTLTFTVDMDKTALHLVRAAKGACISAHDFQSAAELREIEKRIKARMPPYVPRQEPS